MAREIKINLEPSSVAKVVVPVLAFLGIVLTAVYVVHHRNSDIEELNRYVFPSDFIFGTSASAYQYEGAATEDGKGLNIWDSFTHRLRGRIEDGSNGDVAVDQYHKYMEDIKLMASLGVDSYRFSISWARILPKGTAGEVNPLGIRYYNLLINALLRHGIKPMVTLYHFDLPQALEDKYNGWLSSQIIEDFTAYAEICFKEFGDRVKYWQTMNEPNMFVPLGYVVGDYPPLRCTSPRTDNKICTMTNASDPYIAAHHVLLAHASAVDLFRSKYQPVFGGQIGLAMNSPWYEPLDNTPQDREAADRLFAFNLRWFLDPIVYGNYPKEMRDRLGSKLPEFSVEQSNKLRKSFDFIGLNYYFTIYASNVPVEDYSPMQYFFPDAKVYLTGQRKGVLIGEKTGLDGSFAVPRGIQELVEYLTLLYDRPTIIITENGYSEQKSKHMSLQGALNDLRRIQYHKEHLAHLVKAMRNGADVKGYFVWSLLDNFEWSFGYTVKFGLCHVDPKTQERRPKLSALWYKKFLQKKHDKMLQNGNSQSESHRELQQQYPSLTDCRQSRDALGGFCSPITSFHSSS